MSTDFNSTKRLFILRKKYYVFLRDAHTNRLFKDSNIVKFHDKTALEKCILIHEPFKHKLSNHLIAGLHFPQISIPTTQDCPIWADLTFLLKEPNYMEEILLALVKVKLALPFFEKYISQTSLIMYLLLPLLPQRFLAFVQFKSA